MRWGSLLLLLACGSAFGWGDEGHEVIALVADHYLDPSVRGRVTAILKGDKTKLTSTDLAHEATWADKFRDSDRNTTKKRFLQTRQWHFVDIELQASDLDAACFGHPALGSHVASKGPPQDCVVDKIDEFTAELTSSSTSTTERRLALQFLLHFVGDIHQPLHSSDDQDAGGNGKNVTAVGFKAGKLHAYWDTQFVQRLGQDPGEVADMLINNITDAQVQEWSQGTPSDWAMESFAAGRDHAYGMLPQPNSKGSYRLTAAYINDATNVVATQLSKAGVRLANVLNDALR